MRIFDVNFSSLRADLFFSFYALFFGLSILVLTPPFQAPDEINHFYRAYQISEGNFISLKNNNRVGGYVPAGIENITQAGLGMRWNVNGKTNCREITEQFKITLNEKEKKFVDFPNTAMYSPVSYFPQAAAIFILKQFNVSPLSIFYGARVCTLLIWVFGIAYSIRLMPFYKWFTALIALLPMSLFINMSVSADMVTNLVSFILIAYILKLAYSAERVSRKNFAAVCIMAVFLASAKLVYIPIVLLFFLIPAQKFKDKRTYFSQLILLFIISLVTCLCWSKIMYGLYLPYSMYNPAFRDTATLVKCADMQGQMHYILTHGMDTITVFVNSMLYSFNMYFAGFIGTLGWLDTKFPIWFIYGSYTVLLIGACIGGAKGFNVTLKHKAGAFIILTFTLCLILLSQHLTWDCVGGNIISTLQGRYFIPIALLFFMPVFNSKYSNAKLAIPIILIFSLFSLSFTVKTLYTRYYEAPVFSSVTITCGAEKITKNNFFETNKPGVFLIGATSQCKQKVRSGNYSIKLSPKDPFGFTYTINNCDYGDKISVSVWRYGKHGDIVISGGENKFYMISPQPFEKDSAGWEHVQLNFSIPITGNKEEIGIFIYNNTADSSYFDDMIISYDKLR